MNAQPYVDPPRLRDDYVLADAAVVDVETGEVTPHQDVRIRDGRIASISCHGTDHGDREVVEASGQFVVPAYVDAHAHPLNHPDEVDGAYALMLAAGVAGYRQMSSDDSPLRRRREGALREAVGAPALLAPPGDVITPITAPNPEATAATVRRQKAAGADFVKAVIASHDAFMATLRTAREVGPPSPVTCPTASVRPRPRLRGCAASSTSAPRARCTRRPRPAVATWRRPPPT